MNRGAALDRQVGGGGGTETWIGVEHEFSLRDAGGVVDFRALVSGLPHGLPALDPGDPSARRLPSGAVLTADGREAEVATPPLPVSPGCTGHLLHHCETARAVLLASLHGQTVVEGYSTHLNVTARDRHVVRTARRFLDAHALPMMLLMDRADSPGLLVRPRRGRLELGGEYLTGRGLRVASVFATASVIALQRHRAPRDLHVPVRVEPAHGRYGFYVDRTASGLDVHVHGRATVLGDRTAQQQLLRVWEWTRPLALRGFSTAEVGLVDDAVSGRTPLPGERSVSPEDAPQARRALVTTPDRYGEALVEVVRGRWRITPRMVTWTYLLFDVVGADGESFLVGVPGARLTAFRSQLTSGALDRVLDELGSRRHSLPVLASRDQTRRVGAFRRAVDLPALVPGEREPLTGRIGSGGGPGSRQDKERAETPPGRPSAARVISVPRGRGRLAVLGAVAAVVLIGGGSAVLAATRSDDSARQVEAATADASEGPSAGEEALPSTPDDGGSEAVGASEPDPVEGLAPFRGTWTGTFRLVGPSASRTQEWQTSIECRTSCRVVDATFPFSDDSVELEGDPLTGLRFRRAQQGTPCDDEAFQYGLVADYRFDGDRLVGTFFSPAAPRGGGSMRCGGGRSSFWTGLAKGSRFVGTLSGGTGPSR